MTTPSDKAAMVTASGADYVPLRGQFQANALKSGVVNSSFHESLNGLQGDMGMVEGQMFGGMEPQGSEYYEGRASVQDRIITENDMMPAKYDLDAAMDSSEREETVKFVHSSSVVS